MNEELAQRAVACKHWRWMPGMLTKHGLRAERNGDGMVAIWHDRKRNEWGEESLTGGLPDLTDPATIGCLLALVREAWGDDGITTSCTRCGGGTGWSVHRSSPVNGVSALVPVLSESEATVLICALEAAP